MDKTIRAKFRCDEKTQRIGGYNVFMTPVAHGSPENESFFKWAPYGKLEIGVVSDEVVNQFEVGKEYYIDITKAE